MIPLRRHSTLHSRTALGLALLTLTVLAACNGGNGDIEPTAAELPRNAFEQGTAPIFWQPLDEEFKPLRAGEPYRLLFRVTSGYSEETIRIVAECSTCPDGTARVEFEPLRAESVGPEAPGAYYPLSLDLPQPGNWVLTVVAGINAISIQVEVKPADG